MGSKLYVGNLSYSTTEEALRSVFEEGGKEVRSVAIILDRETGRSRGFAFVQMASEDAAREAMESLDGRELDGRQMRITEARERERGGEGARGLEGRGGPRGERREGGWERERVGPRDAGRGRESSAPADERRGPPPERFEEERSAPAPRPWGDEFPPRERSERGGRGRGNRRGRESGRADDHHDDDERPRGRGRERSSRDWRRDWDV
ncbi:RNA recognition motif domain-containing protein [Haliangium ochraceum]|uniref:RNP-1 like RNA-binding protein n=1 Tax=Haliangium ochraceum (strain DSM 14365 / JCM 11303 / SMP-2) TaxID=502025 RepID=D0LUC0_HALO1|nr:RNA-binding protein [Haliangium ochraceum]ACY19243.1 RNP-1 like RNA-binding protein [Haliangium ochraceum DSM 14365]